MICASVSVQDLRIMYTSYIRINFSNIVLPLVVLDMQMLICVSKQKPEKKTEKQQKHCSVFCSGSQFVLCLESIIVLARLL